MAAKGISTGIEQVVSRQKMQERTTGQLQKHWQEIRNRIDSVLMSNNVMKSSDLVQRCRVLDTLSIADRETYVKEQWGPLYFDRVSTLLQQLANLEEQLAGQPN